jgi:beta-mannosidase
LFSSTLSDVVARLDPEVTYWPSSPSSDYEDLPAGMQSGDSHNWDVWHGRVPFSDYEKHHERFVSEYGFQSFPELHTVEAYTDEADRKDAFTDVMKAHQKSPIGNSVIHDYILKDYSEPKDFQSFLYVSQVLQAEGVKIGAEHLRQIRPRNMGSIFWQLNDCWPVASWSSIDYYGRWKALQYYARRFYSPTLVSPHVEGGSLKVYVISDATAEQNAHLRLRLMTFSGTVLREISKDVAVPALSSAVYVDAPIDGLLPAGTDPATVAVAVDLQAGEALLSSNLIYLVPTKRVHLPMAEVGTQISRVAGGVKIQLKSPVLARSVHLSLETAEASRPNLGDVDRFSDDYFDLLPGEGREIVLHTAMSVDQVRAALRVTSLADAFGPSTPRSAANE